MQAGSFQKKFPNLTLKGKVMPFGNASDPLPRKQKNAEMHLTHIPALFVFNKAGLTR